MGSDLCPSHHGECYRSIHSRVKGGRALAKSSKKKICVAQLNFNTKSIQTHLAKIESIVEEHKSSDLIVFPELILHGHPSIEKPEGFLHRRMKTVYKSISQDLYELVRDLDARVIIGESKRWGERYYNMATYVDRNTIQSYAKTHVHWTESFVPGRALKVFEAPFGKIGVTICFDAAFSEVWRVLALKGAGVVVNISAVPREFPVSYMSRRLAGAAIFNQIYVIYANRAGPVGIDDIDLIEDGCSCKPSRHVAYRKLSWDGGDINDHTRAF